MNIDRECDAFVADMMKTFGARFNVILRGSADESRWTYEVSNGMREPARARLKAFDLHSRIGGEAALVRAILRTKFVDAP